MEKGLQHHGRQRNSQGPSPFSLFPFPALQRHPLRISVLALAALVLAPTALAQSCSMCYDGASQQSPQASTAMNTGILVLLLPSVLLFAGVLVTAFRRRETQDDSSQ